MKLNISKYTLMALGLSTSMAFTGCIEETFPTTSVTSEQIAKDPDAVATIVNSLSNYLIDFNTYGGGTSYLYDAGIPGQMIARDEMCEDMPTYDYTMDFYFGLAKCQYADWGKYPYYYFYTFIDKINDVLKSVDESSMSDDLAHMVGNLHGYRAMCYLDLARMYEFQLTGYSKLDDEATNNKIIGLTVPIKEARDYTVAELVKNPRAPFYTMYRFIMTDLNKAEEYLDGYSRPKVSLINQSVVWGFKARLWLEMASRFDRSSEDLAAQMAAEGSDDGYEDLGITSAMDCYRNAALYADKVISAGYTPMTSDEWHDSVNGFNKPNNSWVWGSYITTQAEAQGRWYNFATQMCTDAVWAWSQEDDVYRCISKALFDAIPEADWRKTTWIDPDDAGMSNANGKYSTVSANFTKFPAYANLKFHTPDTETWQNGVITCVPFMRVEEMYLLRAEALYHTAGLQEAVSKLEDFVNTYRYTDDTYECDANDYTSFRDELMIQRRIELWGEGLVYYDYKRLRLGINKAYTGTNFAKDYRLVTEEGHVAPWMNIYTPEDVSSMKDTSFKGNPNFSGVVTDNTAN